MTERDRDRDPGPGTAAAQLRENKSRKKSTTDASLTQEVSSRDCAGYITSIHKDDVSAHEELGGNTYQLINTCESSLSCPVFAFLLCLSLFVFDCEPYLSLLCLSGPYCALLDITYPYWA